MAKYDIQDFDYGSMVDQISGITGSRKKPNFLKRYAPQIIETLVGVTDNYKTYNLKTKMEDANFENTLEVARLKAEAAKQLKRHNDTKPQYNKLIENGFSFEKEQVGQAFSEGNRAAARKVFGDQAWSSLTSQFSKALPRQTLTSYDDYQTYKAQFGVSKEDDARIENYYNSFVENKANYVYSGQAFDYDQFSTNLASLEEMDIDVNVADAGLLSKLSGALERSIDYRQEQIDLFKSTYLKPEAAKMSKALQVWENSTTPEEYAKGIKNFDIGYMAALKENQAEIYIGLSDTQKTKISTDMEKVWGREEGASVLDIQQTFNALAHGVANPTEGRSQLTVLQSKQLLAIENNKTLTSEEKQEQVSLINEKFKSLKEEYGPNLSTAAQADILIRLNNRRTNLEKDMTPLIEAQKEGTINLEDIKKLDMLDLELTSTELQIDNLGLPANSITTQLSSIVLQNQVNSQNTSLAFAILAKHTGTDINVPRNELKISTPFTAAILQSPEMRNQPPGVMSVLQGIAATPVNPQLPSRIETPGKAAVVKLTDRIIGTLNLSLQSDGNEVIENGKKLPTIRGYVFPDGIDDDTLKELRDVLNLNPDTSKGQQRLQALGQTLSDFEITTSEIIRVNNENVRRGLPGYFHGNSSPSDDFLNKAMTKIFIENQIMKGDDDNYIGRPVVTEQVAQALWEEMKEVGLNSSETGSINPNTLTLQQVAALADQANAEGKNETAMILIEEVSQSYADPEAVKKELEELSMTVTPERLEAARKNKKRRAQPSDIKRYNELESLLTSTQSEIQTKLERYAYVAAEVERLSKLKPDVTNILLIENYKEELQEIAPNFYKANRGS